MKELGRASPYLIGALKLILTQPFDIDTVPKSFRGDYFNVSLTLDLTYSAVDNAFLTGTGLSGALRALEQSFGRDPETMIPDVRYTPNPNDAPGGPLVERGDRQLLTRFIRRQLIAVRDPDGDRAARAGLVLPADSEPGRHRPVHAEGRPARVGRSVPDGQRHLSRHHHRQGHRRRADRARRARRR